MKTQTLTLLPIVGALKMAYEFKKQATGPWVCRNEMQEFFLKNIYRQGIEDLARFNEDELKFLASFSHIELNHWLKDNGFDIQLDPFKEPTDFGAGTIQDVSVAWKEKAQKLVLMDTTDESKEYNYVRMSDDHVSFHGTRNPIAHIETSNGDEVYMMMEERLLEDAAFGLINIWPDILNVVANRKEEVNYSALKFPMVDINDQPNIEWLKKMYFNGVSAIDGMAGEMTVKQALQQTFFKMNEEGARVKSAAVVGMARCASVRMPKPEMVIDKPFYLWISRPGTCLPYFAARIDKDCWKNPGGLSMPGDKR